MTNEQLATFIGEGGNDELIPILWAKIQRLMYMKSDQFYREHSEQCLKSGVEVWDVKQCCYDAFLQAVKGYKSEDENKFTSYLQYPFKNAVNALLGLRTGRAKQEPLNNCLSLDKPISEDCETESTLNDFVEDKSSLDFVESIETEDEYRILHEAVSELDEPFRMVIEKYYFEDMTYKQIAESAQCSIENIRTKISKAIKMLRTNRDIKQLYRAQTRDAYFRNVSRQVFCPEYFEEIRSMKEYIRKSSV